MLKRQLVISEDCKGRVKTEDLNVAFPFTQASDPDTSSYNYGPLLTLDPQCINRISITLLLFRDNVCNCITHEMITITITCIHSFYT